MNAEHRVEIVAPSGKVTTWDSYPNRAEADDVARKLRVHGFFAQVRRVEIEATRTP